MAATNSHDDQRLVRYLIGALTEDETERLDELSIADDRLAADLRVVENDLVDAYARGALSGDTLHGFETHYLSLPGAFAKVEFARALLRHEQAATASGAVRSPSVGWTRPALQWGLAAAAVLFLATTSYFLSENVRLRRQVADLRAGVEAGQRQLEQQTQRERTASADAARALERARQSIAQAQESTRQSEPPNRTVIASLVLMPPVRGGGAPRTLPLSQRAGDVAVRLTLDADEFPSYRVALRDAVAGQVVWRSGSLRPVPDADMKALSFTVGAESLQPRTYVFEVSGVRARAAAESVANYPFKVVLQ
ncbi:MAG TPA: hypothetical protein VGJ29_19825 [Vicinamibacterales bacterium]